MRRLFYTGPAGNPADTAAVRDQPAPLPGGRRGRGRGGVPA